jgi:hypothetical protein
MGPLFIHTEYQRVDAPCLILAKPGVSGTPCHTQTMDQRIDHLTATYVDLATTVAAIFGVEVGLRVLQQSPPLYVEQHVFDEVDRDAAALL